MHSPSAFVAIDVDGGVGGGKFDLALAYASKAGGSFSLRVNGKEQSNLLLPKTGGWGSYKAVKLSIRLKPGRNRMEIRGGRGGANLDYVDLKRSRQF